MKMKRFLAFLLAIFMIVPLFAQIIVFADTKLSYTKSTQAYTVAGKSYYAATLDEDYNGVKAGEKFFVDSDDNIVTDKNVLLKLKQIAFFNNNGISDLIRSGASSAGKSTKHYYNAFVAIANEEELGKIIGKASGTLLKLCSGQVFTFTEVLVDVGKEVTSPERIKETALIHMLEVYANNADAYLKQLNKYLSKPVYDYETMLAVYSANAECYASLQAIQFLAGDEIADYANDSTWDRIWNYLFNVFESLADAVIPDILIVEIVDAVVDGVMSAIPLRELALSTGADNVYTSKFYEVYNSHLKFSQVSETELENAAKLSATVGSSVVSSTYTEGKYVPSDAIGCNIRSGASTANSVVGTIPYGTQFNVMKTEGAWGYTTYSGVSGWVCLDFADKVTAVVSSTVSSIASSTKFYANYNMEAAIAYANKYALSYNSAYYNFASYGGDCANFVSQCLYAGGMPQTVGSIYGTNGWFYVNASNRSATWTGAGHLRNWLANNYGVLINSPTAEQIYPGSPVFYDWEGDGSWDHATICVGVNANGVPLVNSHTSDKYHEIWCYGQSTTKYSTVQLTPTNTYLPVSSKLSAPKITSSSTFASDKNVVLSWELDGADCYGITVVNDQTDAVVFDGDISKSYLDLGRLSAGKYRWQVRGYNGAGWGSLTDLMYFTVTTTSSSDGSLVTRDDGTWFFPVAKEYYQKFSDWCCCPGYDKCVLCGTAHTSWGDSSHSGQKGHNGIDLATPSGTPVYASASGKYYTGGSTSHDRGYYVVIEHDIGNGQAYYSAYQHLSEFSASLQSGDYVNAGDLIGYTGGSGNGSGVHLHFGIVLGASGKGLNGLDTYELWNSANPWATSPSHTQGRIVNNPADNFPTGTHGATLEAIIVHKGSVHYTFDKTKVSIGSAQMQDVLVSTTAKSDYTATENITISWNSFAGAASYGLTVTKKTGSSWTSRDIVYDKNGLIGTSVNLGKFDVGEYRFNMGAHSSDGTLLGNYSELSYFTVKTTTASDDFEWSEWSDWSTEKPAESDTVEVESKTQYGYYHYILQYSDGKCGAYPIDSATFNRIFPSYPTTQKDYHTKYFDTQLSKTETLTYDKAYDCYINNCCPDAYDYDNGSNASYFYYLGTRTVYRSRTKISNSISVTGVFLNKSSVSLNVGETETLVAAIMPSDATNNAVTWSSSDPSVAKIRNGVITALSEGTAEITVTTEDGNKTSTCTVTVTPATSGVKAVMSSATASHGETIVLTVTLAGAPLTNSLGFKLILPDGITLVEGENTRWEIDGEVTDINVSKLQGVWLGAEDVDVNGMVLSIELKVESSAALGENEIKFEFYPNDDDASKTPEAVSETSGVIYVCNHDYNSEWSNDQVQHWHECALCHYKVDIDTHKYTNACDTTCNECAYTRTINHQTGTEWFYDNTHHWHKCTVCEAEVEKAEHNEVNGVCTECEKLFYIAGDIDGKEGIYAEDALYLLYSVFFGEERYPLNQNCDFDGNGTVEAADAVYLLYHVFFGDEYPLN